MNENSIKLEMKNHEKAIYGVINHIVNCHIEYSVREKDIDPYRSMVRSLQEMRWSITINAHFKSSTQFNSNTLF